MNIKEKLKDLHKQATEERSHNYTGTVILEAIAEIERLEHVIILQREYIRISDNIVEKFDGLLEKIKRA